MVGSSGVAGNRCDSSMSGCRQRATGRLLCTLPGPGSGVKARVRWCSVRSVRSRAGASGSDAVTVPGRPWAGCSTQPFWIEGCVSNMREELGAAREWMEPSANCGSHPVRCWPPLALSVAPEARHTHCWRPFEVGVSRCSVQLYFSGREQSERVPPSLPALCTVREFR